MSHWLQDSHKSGNLRYLSNRKKYHVSTGCVMTTVTQSIRSGISWIREHNNFYHLMYFFPSFSLAKSSSHDLQRTASLQIIVLLQIIFCSCIIKLKLRSCVKMADRFPKQVESDLTYFNNIVDQRNGDRMIKQLLNSVYIPKYHQW